ncbi:MAG: PPC domain-containing protein [Gemmatimonadota bacterium]
MRCPPARFLSLLALLSAAPALAQGPRAITVGQTVTDSLTGRDPVGRSRHSPYHLWTLEGRRGQKLVIDLMSDDFDPYLVLRDEEGYVVGSDDDSGEDNNSRIHAILPRDGRYRIVAMAFGEDGRGSYSLQARGWETPEAPPAGTVAPIRPGEAKDGLLEPGDEIGGDGPFQDRWTIDARAGARLRVELRSTDFDSYLMVLGPDGQVVGSDDDGLEGRDAVVSLRTATAGGYTIVATTYGENPSIGAYRLAVTEETGSFADPGTAAPIAVGETKDGRLESGDLNGTRGLEDRWTFTGRAGQVIRIDAMSPAFDAYAVLRFGQTPLDSNDDGGDGNNSRIMTILPNNGTYTIAVSSYSESRTGGRYTLALSASSTAVAPAGQTARIAYGQRLAGRLESGDRARDEGGTEDWWEFDGRTGQDVTIELRSGAFDTFLELRDPRGTKVADNDDGLGEGADSFIIAHLAQSGRYRIVARGYGDREASGFYELSLAQSGAVGRAGQVQEIRPGQTIVGRLEAGDSTAGDSTYTDVFAFLAIRTGDIVIDLRSGDFDAYLIVQDAEGHTIGTDDDGGSGTDSQITTRVTAGTSYRIRANSYGEDPETGLYRLSIRYTP